ncbi:MAG: hypothetical protein HY735_21480 [Verrucomicrobia bacterium]|nr:hypothetical protein [Verrucomicrobiota bacterium]
MPRVVDQDHTPLLAVQIHVRRNQRLDPTALEILSLEAQTPGAAGTLRHDQSRVRVEVLDVGRGRQVGQARGHQPVPADLPENAALGRIRVGLQNVPSGQSQADRQRPARHHPDQNRIVLVGASSALCQDGPDRGVWGLARPGDEPGFHIQIVVDVLVGGLLGGMRVRALARDDPRGMEVLPPGPLCLTLTIQGSAPVVLLHGFS